ncbi:MAG TPA: hypothetical protein VM101_04645 [Flavitalea sp.]|nr:hypothetical protein [Flavitalea sp.]
MKETKLLIFFFSFFLCVNAQKTNLKYNISVSLNDKEHALDGFLQLDYYNTSHDTLRYLWFNIYPNAFKSDRTAFSEYLLEKGRTDFYFAGKDRRGYINRLEFRSGVNILRTEDHPLFLDIIKVLLERPLSPGGSVMITTPFHVKLPYDFDGIGYIFPEYHLKYWYPAVAEYIKPLTTADSSSNVLGDYTIQFVVKQRYSISSPFLKYNPEDAGSADSLKTVLFVATSAKDVPVTIIIPQSKSLTRSASKDHDIFSFLKKSDIKSNSSRLFDSISKKIISHPIVPVIGFNKYDGFQFGILSQNFLKEQNYSYYLAPVYAFKSKNIAGIGELSYAGSKFQAGLSASAFSYDDGVDTNHNKVFARLFKVVPYIKFALPKRSSKVQRSFTLKNYLINVKDLAFVKYGVDSFFYPSKGKSETRYVNEFSFDYSSDRILYPYHAQLQAQQGKNWYRLNATGNYFFNYAKGGGMNVRLFAAKFGYIGNITSFEKFATTHYQPKLTAVRGGEDFTYSNYFIGRNTFEGLSSHQIMIRDGGLKLRTDIFEGLQGRSDNWIAAVNLNSSFPNIFLSKVPLKIFFDAGTFAEAWDTDNPNPRFLYVAGMQLSLFKDVLNIYAPLLYSNQYRDQFKSVPEENTFIKKLSFSIDLQRLNVNGLRYK